MATTATTATANHAFRTLKFELDPVFRSPTSLQYKDYRHHSRTKASTSPYFKPRFTFKSEDRKRTLGHPDFQKAGADDPLMPLYPYGKCVHFQEANFGLYGGATIRSGNKVSKGRNKGKTLRHWFPNVRLETVRSEALGRELRIPITARVMRTIKKCGGLDEYVCGEKPARIKELGLLGWRLRWLIMTSPKKLEEYAQQRKELGLEGKSPLVETFEDVWNDPDRQAKLIKQQEVAWQSLRDAAKRFETHVQNQWIDAGEKHHYKIPQLQTLKKEDFKHFGLPSTLPEYYHDEVIVPGVGQPSPDTAEVTDEFLAELEAEGADWTDYKKRPDEKTKTERRREKRMRRSQRKKAAAEEKASSEEDPKSLI